MKIPALILFIVPSLGFAVAIDDLWITEVVPSTGQMEVTHVGDGLLTISSARPFDHRFRYSDPIPSGTTFLQASRRQPEAGMALVAGAFGRNGAALSHAHLDDRTDRRMIGMRLGSIS